MPSPAGDANRNTPDAKGAFGCPRAPPARLVECSLDLFGYLHVVMEEPASLAPEERTNQAYLADLTRAVCECIEKDWTWSFAACLFP